MSIWQQCSGSLQGEPGLGGPSGDHCRNPSEVSHVGVQREGAVRQTAPSLTRLEGEGARLTVVPRRQPGMRHGYGGGES